MTIIRCMVPEILSATNIIFCHFGKLELINKEMDDDGIHKHKSKCLKKMHLADY